MGAMQSQPTPCHILDVDTNTWWLPDDKENHKDGCIHFSGAVIKPPETPVPASPAVVANGEAPVQQFNGQATPQQVAAAPTPQFVPEHGEKVEEEQPTFDTWQQALDSVIPKNYDPLWKIKLLKFIEDLLVTQQQHLVQKLITNLFKD